MDDQANVVGARPSAAERPQESGAAALGRGGRMSRQHKTAAVLRLLRGEDLETVSRALGVTAATLTGWHDAFLAGGEAALTSRPGSGEELQSDRLKACDYLVGASNQSDVFPKAAAVSFLSAEAAQRSKNGNSSRATITLCPSVYQRQ